MLISKIERLAAEGRHAELMQAACEATAVYGVLWLLEARIRFRKRWARVPAPTRRFADLNWEFEYDELNNFASMGRDDDSANPSDDRPIEARGHLSPETESKPLVQESTSLFESPIK